MLTLHLVIHFVVTIRRSSDYIFDKFSWICVNIWATTYLPLPYPNDSQTDNKLGEGSVCSFSGTDINPFSLAERVKKRKIMPMSKILNFNLWTILHENMSRMNFAEKRFDKIPISSPGSFWLLASGMVVITSKVHHLPTVAHNCRGKRNNLAAKEITFVARLFL